MLYQRFELKDIARGKGKAETVKDRDRISVRKQGREVETG